MYDTQCFEAIYDGTHVRNRYELRKNGKVIFAGETIYSVEGSAVVFTDVSFRGGVGHGEVRADGPVLSFDGQMRDSPADAPGRELWEWRVVDANHYEARSPIHGPVRFTRVKTQPHK